MDDTSRLDVTGLEGLLVLKHATGKDEALLRGRDAGDGLDLELQGADGGGGAVAVKRVFMALGVQDADRILELVGVDRGGRSRGGKRRGWSWRGGGGRGGDGGGGNGGGEGDCEVCWRREKC